MDKKVISLDHLEPFTKNFYEESRRLIRTAMADHNLVIFVGAGVSLDSGMPSWSKAVSQIADKLGYKTVQHLSQQFKKITGFSPSQFQELKEKKRLPIDFI